MQHQIRFFEKFPARVFVFSLSAPAGGYEPAAKKYFADNPEQTVDSGVAKVTFAIQLRLAYSAQPTNNSLQHIPLSFLDVPAAAAAEKNESSLRTCSRGRRGVREESTCDRGPPNQSPHVYITAPVRATE